jgi:hypothetical protein
MYLDRSYSDLSRCEASNNSAINGGGIHVHGGTFAGNELSLSSNKVSRNGGGMIVYACETYDLTYSNLTRNHATMSGGGMFVVGATSKLDVSYCDFLHNEANEYGGGLYIREGDLTMDHINMESNKVTSSTFEWVESFNNTNCRTVGGCIFSSNFPSKDYDNYDLCVWQAVGSGTLLVNNFATENLYDILKILNSDGDIVDTFSGEIGPEDYTLTTNQYIVWTSDPFTTHIGFDICFEVGASGGGFYMEDGTLLLTSSSIMNNTATRYGGGLHVDGGSCQLVDLTIGLNSASTLGDEVYQTGGVLTSTNMKVQDFTSTSLGGSSIQTTSCSSSCLAGQYANCTVFSTASSCYANCECESCPAGRYSASSGSTTASDCLVCSAGHVSSEGATQCTSCPVGKYATDNASDVGNGLVNQIFNEASSCNPCSAGYFSSSEATTVCQVSVFLLELYEKKIKER